MKQLYKIPLLLPLLIIVAGIVVFKKPVVFTELPPKGTVCEGVVIESSRVGNRQRMTVEVTLMDEGTRVTKPKPFRTTLAMNFFTPAAYAGDLVRFSGTYTLAQIETDLPLENDYSASAYRGIALRCFVPISDFEILGRSNNPVYALTRWRNRLVDSIYASSLSDNSKAVIAAVIAGDDTNLPDEMRSNFAVAGVAHVLALSGAHLAVIIMLIAWALWPLRAAGHRRLGWWATIAGIWVFAIATGLSPSVSRSAIMATGVLLAYIFDRPRSSLNMLCLAGMLILSFSPFSLYRPGFQLSFLATLAIILYAQRPVLQRSKRWIKTIVGIIGVTIAATLGTMPIVAYTFHIVPLCFLATNIVAVALFPVLIAAGVGFIVLLMFGVEPGWLVATVDFLTTALDAMTSAVSALPFASVGGIYFPMWLLIPAYVGIAALFAAYLRKSWLWAAAGAATLLLTVGIHYLAKPSYPSDELYITREKHFTNVIIRHADAMRVLTTVNAWELTEDSAYVARRYHDYIATRGVNSITVERPDSAGATTFEFDGRTIRFATLAPPAGHTDYCLVTRGFRGDIVELWMGCNADTLLLATDIHKIRRERYARELAEADIPFRNLSVAPLVLRNTDHNNQVQQ